ncbi:MAG: M67 family metallopeptidase [Acidimicrobiia bacterium]
METISRSDGPDDGPWSIRLSRTGAAEVVEHARRGMPDEACGLLAGAGDCVEVVYCTANADASPVSYRVDSRDQWAAMRDAEARGLEMLGGFHSHTRSDAYPSPTDVAQASYPEWAYLVVGLRDRPPVMRAFRILAGEITEIPVHVDPE